MHAAVGVVPEVDEVSLHTPVPMSVEERSAEARDADVALEKTAVTNATEQKPAVRSRLDELARFDGRSAGASLVIGAGIRPAHADKAHVPVSQVWLSRPGDAIPRGLGMGQLLLGSSGDEAQADPTDRPDE